MFPRRQVITRRQKAMYMNHVLELAKKRLIDCGLNIVRDMAKDAEARRRRRRPWIRDWVQRRRQMGAECLIQEVRTEDPKTYRNILRMDSSQFEQLLQMIAMDIQRQDTNMRYAIPARIRNWKSRCVFWQVATP